MDLLLLLRSIALKTLAVTIIIVGAIAVFGWYHPADDDWAGFVSYLPSFFGTIFVIVFGPVAIISFIYRAYQNEKSQYHGPREFRISKSEKGFKSKYRIKALAWLMPGWILALSLDDWSSASGEPIDWSNMAGFLLFFILTFAAFRTKCEGCNSSAADFIFGEKREQRFGSLVEFSKFIFSKRCTMCDLERH